MKTTFYIITLSAILFGCSNDSASNAIPDTVPDFATATFTNPTSITNSYYGPQNGQTYVYMAGEVGSLPNEEIRIQRRTSTKTVKGINCIIHHDLVSLNGILIEDTDDWIAQDDNGNLWYFGEYSKRYDDLGNFIDTQGSWEAGVNNALPGYWMPTNPTLGQKYHQEYYKNEAEDQAEVIAVGLTVTIGLGTYNNCIATKDFTKFETNIYEKKYYAPNIGLIKEEKFEDGVMIEVEELTEIIN